MRNPLRRPFARLDGSLRARLVVPTAVLAAASSALMVLTASELYGGDMRENNRDRAMLFASLSTEAVRSHMATYQHGDLAAMLQALAEHRTDVRSMSIISREGVVGSTTDPALRGGRPWPTGRYDTSGPVPLPGGDFALLRPISSGRDCASCHQGDGGDARWQTIGWLEMRFSNAALIEAQHRLSVMLWLAALPALLLLLGVSWWLLGREAVHPIQRLVAAMQAAEEGRARRADEGRTDEIGQAARKFDATLAALRRSRAELEKVYQERMERADRFAMIGQMATGLAHEIKNPLAGLSGALELLAEDLARSPQQGEVVAEMRHQVARLARIMESLLSFARPPKAVLQTTSVNLALEKVLFLLEQQRARVPLKIERRLGEVPAVIADASQLEQVFLNITLNAFQALSDAGGGTLTVHTRAEAGAVIAEVADTGPGIPPAVRPSIFTPYFTTRPNGTGLGLALSMRLITEHQGTLSFRCPEAGGTVFTVTLPAAPVPKPN